MSSSWVNKDLSGHIKTCTACEYETKESHNTSGGMSSNSSVHWSLCSICGGQGASSSSHTVGSTYEHNTTNHWQVCSVCSATTNNATHSWNPGSGGTYMCGVCYAYKLQDGTVN